jgi:4-hydroxythreonine-4-phosphate dehydrogenase
MRIIFSMGDPNGIGVEVMLKAVAVFDKSFPHAGEIEFHISGNPDVILKYCELIGLNPEPRKAGFYLNNRFYTILNCMSTADLEFGKISLESGKLSAEAVELAVEATIDGKYDAMVTMPVSKSALYLAGWKFPGHTEMIAHACGTTRQLMILATGSLRVAPATIHIPIKEVPFSISKDLLIKKLEIFNHSLLQDFGIKIPSLAVLGLNPHAGEEGSIGMEEINIISPAIEEVKAHNINVSGPYPSDGFFAHGDYKRYDGVLSMYHDQGLIPLKLIAAGGGVNFTAGLPIVRTSPDHGTAFALAGKGSANPGSAVDAIEMAIEIVNNRKKQ